jgi:hypothetical protein
LDRRKNIKIVKCDHYSRKNIPNIGIVGAAVGRVSITAVGSTVFATLSKAVFYKMKNVRAVTVWNHRPRKIFSMHKLISQGPFFRTLRFSFSSSKF